MDLKIAIALHLVFAGTFVGANVFLDFILTPRLSLVPPGQAARLGEKIGVSFMWLSWSSLAGIPLSGAWLLWRTGMFSRLAAADFYATGYGFTLAFMMTVWATLVATGSVLTFWLRPRIVVKLPYDATREDVEGGRTNAVRYATWMRRLATYNAVAGLLGLVAGGFLRYGGFF